MTDDTGLGDAIEYVFGDETPPSIGRELQQMGATRSQGTCSNCDGPLYDYDHEVICGNCSTVIGATTRSQSSSSKWTQFDEHRPTYHRSGIHKCVGGFPHAYSWVSSDDIDHPVNDLDSDEFYQ